MTIEILRNNSTTPVTFTDMADALRALLSGDTLILPSDRVTHPFVIDVSNVTLLNDGPPAYVELAADVTRFYVADGSRAVVQTNGDATKIYGADGETYFYGNSQRDRFYGGSGDEVMFGGGGNDHLYAGQGNDFIVLGWGSDRARGGGGGDIIVADHGTGRVWGGGGADRFEVHVDGTQRTTIFDFRSNDVLEIVGHGGLNQLSDVSGSVGRVFQNTKGHTVIKIWDARIELRNTSVEDLADLRIRFVDAPRSHPTVEQTPEFFSPTEEPPEKIVVDGVDYMLRDDEPGHENFKFQDRSGNWYSPDYFVLVAGGQSNMVGSSDTGDFVLNDDVMAYDWFNDRIIQADYGEFPAIFRDGNSARNNLYFPMAVEITEALQRPVLVVNRAYSGSPIETWLASDDASNWDLLHDSVTRALGLVGQSAADAFIWLQGEADSADANDIYLAQLRELIGQIRGSSWGADDLDILMGELSRESGLFRQNAAYQTLMVENDDPDLAIISSAGLVSDDLDGVHFNGPSLNELGSRFADALFDLQAGIAAPPNEIPKAVADGIVASFTVTEGEELRIDVAQYFTDADGDDLFYYGFLDQRWLKIVFEDQDSDQIILFPEYDGPSNILLKVYANDGQFDSDFITFDVTVRDADPMTLLFKNREFTDELRGFADLSKTLEYANKSQGIVVLDSAAIAGRVTLTHDNLYIRGDSGVSGRFALADDVARVTFQGQADFSTSGNRLDNRIVGSDGKSDIHGGGGTDQIFGEAGNDVLKGGGGADRLYGGAGNDFLNGGWGNDRAEGGTGDDTFVFRRRQGDLTVDDLMDGDVVRVSDFRDIDSFGDFLAVATVRSNRGDTLIDIGEQRLVLRDIDTTDLSADMFEFL